MRRTTLSLRVLWGGLLLALLVAGLAGESFSQDVKPTTQDVKNLGKSVIVPLGQSVPLQMSTKKPISKVSTRKEGVVGIRTIPGDPTKIWLIGQTPDVIQLELTDVDGAKETYEIIVQLDVEYLRTQLRRVIPTANIIPVPFSSSGVILTGNVARAEDVDVILNVARSIGGLQIVNALKLGGVQAVQLDVVVAQVSRNQFRAMAFNFLTDTPQTFLGSTVGNAVVNPVSVGVGSASLTVNGLLQGIPGTPNGQGTNVLFGVLHNTHGFLGFLQALRNEGVSKDLAQPSLTTMSGTPASFLVGGQQAIPQPGGLGTISITYQEFGTKLNFLPIVLGNGKIHLEIEPEVSSIDNTLGTSIQGTVVPGFATTRTHATVELETGQTFVMAGFVDHSVQATTNKVPVLGDLPFIGAAFSSKSYTEIEQEMVILVTPHLVDAQDCSQLTKCLPGQESRSPSDFELFLEGILEAPRGPRQVFQNHHYVPAFKNGPTNELFPCAGGRGGAGCATGSCGTAAGCGATAAPVQTAVPARTMAAPAAAQIVPASAVEPMTIHVVPAPASTPRNVDPESLIPALPPDNEN